MAVPPRRRRRLGQHHLRHQEACAPLVAYLAPAACTVVEIGGGGGVLTAALVAADARVWSVELDPAWAFVLARRRLGAGIWVGDAMEIAWDRLPAGCRVAGNLPYGIATALVESLLPHRRSVERAAFLVQLEVAQRLLATPGSPDYGSLSVIVAAASSGRLLGRVRPGSFRPPPRVESAFVGLELEPLPVAEEDWPAFCRLVRLAFAQRRKTLRNSLAASWGRERASEALARAGLEGGRRAETLELGEFLSLFASSRDAWRAKP